ncbi:MAG: flagellar assembly protein FliH [Bryobacterales bacterium]|nr:flagellar assembly protein FliH [Bryobacterales bacterium]
MSSKLIKGGGGREVRAFAWRGDSPKPGVVAFQPKRVGDQREHPADAPPAEPSIDVEAIRKQAFQEGLQAGKSASEKRLAEELAKHAAEFSKLFGELAGYKAVLRNEAEGELVELAFAIARKILRRELSVDAGAVAALVKSCMQDYPSVGVKKVRVHPQDLAMVRGALGPGVEAEADAEIPRGGAILETDQGVLDARIDTQLEEIALGLADV